MIYNGNRSYHFLVRFSCGFRAKRFEKTLIIDGNWKCSRNLRYCWRWASKKVDKKPPSVLERLTKDEGNLAKPIFCMNLGCFGLHWPRLPFRVYQEAKRLVIRSYRSTVGVDDWIVDTDIIEQLSSLWCQTDIKQGKLFVDICTG